MEDNADPKRYEIHIRGRLSDGLLSAFPEFRARTRNRETVLAGPLPDQAALHGVLGRIEALGLELLEVRRARERTQISGETGESRPGLGARTGQTTPDSGDSPAFGRSACEQAADRE